MCNFSTLGVAFVRGQLISLVRYVCKKRKSSPAHVKWKRNCECHNFCFCKQMIECTKQWTCKKRQDLAVQRRHWAAILKFRLMWLLSFEFSADDCSTVWGLIQELMFGNFMFWGATWSWCHCITVSAQATDLIAWLVYCVHSGYRPDCMTGLLCPLRLQTWLHDWSTVSTQATDLIA